MKEKTNTTGFHIFVGSFFARPHNYNLINTEKALNSLYLSRIKYRKVDLELDLLHAK